MDVARKQDVKDITSRLKTARGKERVKLNDTLSSIRKEQSDGWKRSAREALIREARKNRVDNMKDISNDIMKHKDLGRTFFLVPELPWQK